MSLSLGRLCKRGGGSKQRRTKGDVKAHLFSHMGMLEVGQDVLLPSSQWLQPEPVVDSTENNSPASRLIKKVYVREEIPTVYRRHGKALSEIHFEDLNEPEVDSDGNPVVVFSEL